MNDNELSKLLQEQVNVDQADLDNLTERINSMITKKTHQVQRIRRTVFLAWVLFGCLFLAGGFIETTQDSSLLTQTLGLIAVGAIPALLWVSVILTISWFVRSVDLRFERIQLALSTVQEALDALTKQSIGNSKN
jgi:hypothetical protein